MQALLMEKGTKEGEAPMEMEGGATPWKGKGTAATHRGEEEGDCCLERTAAMEIYSALLPHVKKEGVSSCLLACVGKKGQRP